MCPHKYEDLGRKTFGALIIDINSNKDFFSIIPMEKLI